MTVAEFQWGHEFANPWHDEEGKFAPKGTGTQSTGASGQEAAPAADEQQPLKGRTSGADTTALANEVIDGMRFDEGTQTWVSEKNITIEAVDADDVIKQFADAPVDVVDLTAVTIAGSPNMFSQMRESGLPRTEMPQITPDVAPEFFNTLNERGIPFVNNTLDPASLSATQSELNGKKVGGMISALESGKMSLEGDPLMVSSDGHILDGHHRWAATAAMSADCGGCIKIPVIVIDLPMAELHPLALAWTDERGIPRASVATPSKRQAAGMSPRSFTMRGVTQFANFMEGGTPITDISNIRVATDIEDGITPEDTANLPHGDGSAFAPSEAATPAPAAEGETMAYGWGPRGEFMNPWHDEIGRFAPKGTGTKSDGIPVSEFPADDTVVKSKLPTIERDANGDIIPSEEAKRLADPIHEEAMRHEEAITRSLASLVGDDDPANYDPGAPPPPQMYGYEYKFKGPDGIAEKIERKVLEDEVDRETAAADIKDSLRYTVHYTQDEFGPSAQRIIDQLAEQYPGGVVKNTWPPSKDNPYKGVNVNVTTEDGFTFEIQFHTPESQAVKDAQHKIYKNVRHLPDDDPRKIEADAKMMEMAATLQEQPPTGAVEVTTPPKWRRTRAALSAIKTTFRTMRKHWSILE